MQKLILSCLLEERLKHRVTKLSKIPQQVNDTWDTYLFPIYTIQTYKKKPTSMCGLMIVILVRKTILYHAIDSCFSQNCKGKDVYRILAISAQMNRPLAIQCPHCGSPLSFMRLQAILNSSPWTYPKLGFVTLGLIKQYKASCYYEYQMNTLLKQVLDIQSWLAWNFLCRTGWPDIHRDLTDSTLMC